MADKRNSVEKLFRIAQTGKVLTSIIFSVRIVIAINIQQEIFEPLAYSRSGEMTGSILGAASLGAAFSVILGSTILDLTGIRFLFKSSCIFSAAGILLVISGNSLFEGMAVYRVLWAGMLLIGIGIGSVEAGANPLVASIFPDDVQHRMNRLQSWWPMGFVIGGVLGYGMDKIGLQWQFQLALTMLPMAVFWLMLRGIEFPVTRRVAEKVSHRAMYREALRPGFLL